MKFTKRIGVFETNSSSIHAIAIGEDWNKEDIPDEITFNTHDFGWEHEEYKDLQSRADYLYTAIYDMYFRSDHDHYDNWLDYIKDILQSEGVHEVEFNEPDPNDYFSIGEIDHVGELSEWLEGIEDSSDRLLRYLFSKDSEVHTGNDNTEPNEEDVNRKFAKGTDVYMKYN